MPQCGWTPNRGGLRRLSLALPLLVCAVAPTSAQHPSRLNPAQLEEVRELEGLVDGVVQGRLPGGDAWLNWTSHFLRAPDGRTYVPFTLTIEEAPGRFDAVAVYIRVAVPGAGPGAGRLRTDNPGGLLTGQVPVSVPERQFSRGAPTAGEAAAMLSMMEQALKAGARRYAFEDLHFTTTRAAGAGTARQVRRALALAPGLYDVYVSVRERPARGQTPKAAVLKRTLEVPNYSADQLLMSSVILTDRIEPLARPLRDDQQVEHPYALGSVELVPATDNEFASDETLSLACIVYNPALDPARSPRVTIDYRFYQGEPSERLFQQTAPQVFDRQTVGPLDERHREFPVSATIPLAAFSPGAYRLEVIVHDALAGTSVGSSVGFTVR